MRHYRCSVFLTDVKKQYPNDRRMIARLTHPHEWRPTGISELEEAAWEVLRSWSNKVVIAGPGAGKTELLAQRACYLLQTGIVRSDRRILAISFKRDAAKNLKDRVGQRCDTEDAARFDSLTFDAFAKGLLDRFYPALAEIWKPSADYEIFLPPYRTFSDFLDTIGQPRWNNFERDAVVGSPLSKEATDSENPMAYAASKWWETSLRGSVRSRLTFPMIGRLVEFLIRSNPKIRQALCSTYSHVFLDEFQDTTHVQYDLVKSIFLESESVLTAVGDNKQQIMRWAMALDDPFNIFENDFGAERIRLSNNYRSSSELVRIQHRIALSVDTDARPAESKLTGDSYSDACVILEFATPEEEAKYLAGFIEPSIRDGSLSPREFAILVRQKPTDYFKELEPVFRSSGVVVRDEGEIQDILAERLVGILISFLRLGSLQRGGEHWMECIRLTVMLRGSDPNDNSAGRLLQNEVAQLHSTLRNVMAGWPASIEQIRLLVDQILDFLGEDNIKLLYPEYSQGGWYAHVVDRAVSYLIQSCQNGIDWPSALDELEGKNSLPLMTIHKSKGLEYHTIVFLALDDKAWWSFQREPQDSRSTFFVAFSRAKQRVVFTYCRQRGGKSGIASLYGILQSAGVPTYVVK